VRRGEYREVVSYSQAHLRLKTDRGRADRYACACGSRAREWAYTGGDPDELTDGAGRRYSLDQDRYEPMCVPCHRRLDRALADGRSLEVCPSGHQWTPENTGIRIRRARSTGLRYCRACHRETARQWRQANRERRNAYAREYRRRKTTAA